MTVTAIAGPRLDLDGPRPVAPPRSLLSTPGVVISEDDTGRWLNGVNVIGYPEAVPSTWNACDPVSSTNVKAEGEAGPEAQFDPFVCYLPVTCSALSYPFIKDWAVETLEAYSFAVEQALVGTVQAGLGPNPALGDSSVDILASGAAKSAEVALSYLENAIGATGRKGMIHASPASIAALDAFPVTGENDELVTINGTPVVSGGGYAGAEANGQAPGDGQDWMFASGPVEVRISPLQVTDLAESLDRSDNTITFRAERWVLVTWDTALQAAVLVDWDQ